MERHRRGPLVHMEANTLYRLLGEAWVAQLDFRADPPRNYLPSSEEIGRREYQRLLPALHEVLRCGGPHCHNRVVAAIRRTELWHVPAPLIEALAIRSGIARVDRL